MKNIIQVVQHLRPGGIETLSLDLASFTQTNEQMFIVSLEGNLGSALKAWPRLSAYKEQLIFMNKAAGLSGTLLVKLVKLFKLLKVDTVHSHHIGPLLYAGLAARLAGVKHLIHTEHDAWHLAIRKRRLLQATAIKVLTPTLVADAQTVAQNMATHLKCKSPIEVITNGIDTQYFIPGDKKLARATLRLPQQATLIGCSGRLEAVKGQSILIKSLVALPCVHLVLAGIGSMEAELIALTNTLKLQDRVHFLGRIDKMPTFYQALDLFCLPSLNEGYPLAPLEAQSCNIITIVTDVGGAKETLCPESGSLIPANNITEMVAALRTKINEALPRSAVETSNNISSIIPRQHVTHNSDVRVMAAAYADLRY